MLCCVIATVHAAQLFVFIANTDMFNGNRYIIYAFTVLTIFNILFPVLLAFFMVFFNKKMISLPLKMLFLALVCLTVTYTLCLYIGTVIEMYLKGNVMTTLDKVVPLYFGMAYLFLFCISVLPIARYKAGKSKL